MSSTLPIKPGSWRAWLLATRPATLPLACAPVAVGSAIAYKSGCFDLCPALAALGGAILLQLVANLANDLFDFVKGADTAQRLGPPRAAQMGLLSVAQLRGALIAMIIVLVVLGSYLVWHSGVAILVLGIAAILSALAYTAGPLPLAYHGLGDLFVWIFFGYAATCGTVFVQCGHVPTAAWIAGSALGALANAVLVVNHVRDEAQDALAHKKTLVVRWGRHFGVIQYAALLSVAFLVPVFLIALHFASWSVLIVYLLAPWAISLVRKVRNESGVSLNPVLASTAKFSVIYGVLLCLGFIC